MKQWYRTVFLAGNDGRCPGSLDLGPHVVRVVGTVGQHGLAGAPVAHQQAQRLRAVASLAAS